MITQMRASLAVDNNLLLFYCCYYRYIKSDERNPCNYLSFNNEDILPLSYLFVSFWMNVYTFLFEYISGFFHSPLGKLTSVFHQLSPLFLPRSLAVFWRFVHLKQRITRYLSVLLYTIYTHYILYLYISYFIFVRNSKEAVLLMASYRPS